jgi:SAM-dependent MidA family methyltransferase
VHNHALPPVNSLSERLRRLIRETGPIGVATYMAEANAHYYATRDPLGAAGDFTTAPEISQMFGELIGLWLTDLWLRAGRPEGVRYAELGPGRGTLAADALRAMRAAGLVPEVHLVEMSPVLRRAQAERVPQAQWHDDLSTLPGDLPLLAVANEFFDALPARQLIRGTERWHERLVGHDGTRFMPGAGPAVPDGAIPTHLREAPEGSVLETSPASLGVMRALAERIAEQGGAALIVDYGHDRTSAGETLQAVKAHGFADPWQEPGEADLTVHVDFQALSAAAAESGLQVLGPTGQGAFLTRLGIDARLAALAQSTPAQAEALRQGRDRLVGPEQMGSLFRVLGLAAPTWPAPEGFR